jgi:quercetin dioxygenase-like cupin family protein
MQITGSTMDPRTGPAGWLTGKVDIDAVAAPHATSTFAVLVHFTAGARTAWHTHRTARPFVLPARGRPDEVIHPFDRVFLETGENHRHGAAPNRFMVDIAMQQNDESGEGGRPMSWGAHVTDERYGAAPPRAS